MDNEFCSIVVALLGVTFTLRLSVVVVMILSGLKNLNSAQNGEVVLGASSGTVISKVTLHSSKTIPQSTVSLVKFDVQPEGRERVI